MGEILRAVMTQTCLYHAPMIYMAEGSIPAGAITSGKFYLQAKSNKWFIVMGIMPCIDNGTNNIGNNARLRVISNRNKSTWFDRNNINPGIPFTCVGGNLSSQFTLPEYIMFEPDEQLEFEVLIEVAAGGDQRVSVGLAGIEYAMPPGIK